MNWIYKLLNKKIKDGRFSALPFKPGSIVNVKHELFEEPVTSIIQETDENYIYLAYPGEFKGSTVKAGDSAICRILSGNTEYVIYSIINSINLFYPMYLHLKVENILVYDSKRDSKRYYVDYDAYISADDTDGDIIMTARNISRTGLYVSVPKRNLKNFESRGQVLAKLVTNDNEAVNFRAEIVRALCRGRFNEFGMKITHIDEYNRHVYEGILDKLEDELGSMVLSYIMGRSL